MERALVLNGGCALSLQHQGVKPAGPPITPAGMATLKARYDHLLGTERPAIVEMPEQTEVVRTETFAPLLHVVPYADFDEAVAMLKQEALPPDLKG